MGEHPIESLMNTAMNSIKDMIDVNTIIGEPIQASNNTVIIPISKVGFGFAAGGSEFRGETLDEYTKRDKEEQVQYRLPFGGGSGAGVSISPVAFLVVQPNNYNIREMTRYRTIEEKKRKDRNKGKIESKQCNLCRPQYRHKRRINR